MRLLPARLPASSSLRLASYTGDAATLSPEGDLPLRSCLTASAVSAKKPVSFADMQSPDCADLHDLPRDPAVRSVLAAPMLFEGDVMGVLAVFTDRSRLFDNDEKRLCSALASLGAVALQNSRLYARVFASEESLRKNERLTTLGLLAAEIAHEIRNPLTVLKLLHGGLGLDFAEGDPRRTDMRVIGEKLDQLEAIVTRVLNFAKAPTSLHSRYQVAEIVEDTLVLIRLKLAQSKIRVSFEAPAPVDRRRRATRASFSRCSSTCSSIPCRRCPRGARSPSGSGRRPGARLPSRSSTWRTRARASRTPSAGGSSTRSSPGATEGTGLGLAIAKRILQGHHGDIQLVSTSPAGTTLQVTLPLVRG